MWGYVGLTTAFILLASILLWLLISSKAPVIVKGILIAFVMWYGAVLYYTPGNLMGWPISISSEKELPPGSYILYIQIKEPSKKTGDPGAIFFTLVDFSKDKGFEFSLNPKTAFVYKGKSDPRTFKVPYTKKLHKDIVAAQRAKDKEKGSMMRIAGDKKDEKDNKGKGKKGEDGKGKTPLNTRGKFEIVTPYSLLPKEQ